VAPKPNAASLGFTPFENPDGVSFKVPGGGVMERKVALDGISSVKMNVALASCRTWANNIEPYIVYRDADLSHWICKPYLQMVGGN
jgi:hypothetical protein